jgi:hypothetical protein
MKKNRILLSVIGIVLVGSVILVVISKNAKKTFMQDGVLFAVKLDGVSQNSFPSGNNYYVDIDCTNARGRWMRVPSTDGGNDDDYRIVIDNVTGKVECDVNFQTNPSTLKDTITGLITSGNIYEHQTNNVTDWVLEYLPNETYIDYSSASKIESTGYNKTSEFYKTGTFGSTTTASTSGSVSPPDVSLSWDSTNKYWVSDLTQSSLTTARTYYYFFNVTEAGYYEVCYKYESGGKANTLYLYKGTTNMYLASALTASSTGEVCVEYGLLTTSDLIKIGHYTQATAAARAKLDIYIKKGSETTANVGYRYEGKKPNNYIWFNNEMWRIIGVVPTCTASGCSTSENLVKIVRDQSIGGLIGYSDSSGWSSVNLLYQVLNSYYLTKGNATGQSMCSSYSIYSTYSFADCDYRVKGIGETSYYGNMIKNVYWNTGAGLQTQTAAATYGKEIITQDVSGKIGIMNASDYGYANSTHTAALSSYGSAAGTNWLFGQGHEWTLTKYLYGTNELFVDYDGNVLSNGQSLGGNAVRPVVYLGQSVYVVSGDGSEANPYQIAMGS